MDDNLRPLTARHVKRLAPEPLRRQGVFFAWKGMWEVKGPDCMKNQGKMIVIDRF